MVDTVPVAITGAPQVTEIFSPDRNWACVTGDRRGRAVRNDSRMGAGDLAERERVVQRLPDRKRSVGVPPSVNAIEVMFVSAFNALRS